MLVIINGELESISRWSVLIQKDFTFMRRYEIGDETAYRKLECGAGWSGLIRGFCKAVAVRYSQDGIEMEDIDFVVQRIKAENGVLSICYGYKADGGIIDEARVKLRQDIKNIIRTAEKLSSRICESCGDSGKLRSVDGGVRTLCNSCYEEHERH